MLAADTTQDVRFFLQYLDVALCVALCCLAVTVAQYTRRIYQTYHFVLVALLFVVLRVVVGPKTAAWATMISGLLVQSLHAYLASMTSIDLAIQQANPSPRQGLMLTLGWIGKGMFVGAVDIPLTHRMAVSLISMALRTVRLLLVYRTSGEANALTILIMNTIFYFVGFVGAVVGRRLTELLTASCASLLNMLESLPAHAAAPAPDSPDMAPDSPDMEPLERRPSAELDAAGSLMGKPGGQRVPTSPPDLSSSGSSAASSSGGRRVHFQPLELFRNDGDDGAALDALIRQTAQHAREAMAEAPSRPPNLARPPILAPPTLKLQLDVPARPERAASSAGSHEQSLLSQASELSRERELLEAAFAPEHLPAPLASTHIPVADLQLSSMLGKGAFGLVYKGGWHRPDVACTAAAGGAAGDAAGEGDARSAPTSATAGGEASAHRAAAAAAARAARPQRVAIKLIHRHHLEAQQLRLFKRAASLELQLAPHENIVRLHGWSVMPEAAKLLLVMEFCPGGSLAALIDAEATRAWDTRRTLATARHVARGIAFLHGQEPPILHRDLKPANIILDGAGVAKLADFGASRVASDMRMTSWGVGTPLFAAPEQLTYQVYNASVDVWAFGCVASCMANHHATPFGPEPHVTDRVLADVAKGNTRPEVAADHPLHELVRDCCQPSASRPPAAELVERLTARLDELADAQQGGVKVKHGQQKSKTK